MYCDTAQAKAGNIAYFRSCLSSSGPRANSISDLWWMVWQEGVTQIVMLTNIQEGGKVGSWAYCLCPCFCTVQFSSVEFKMVSTRSEKNTICFPPRLSDVSPKYLRKGFLLMVFQKVSMFISCTFFQGRSLSTSLSAPR